MGLVDGEAPETLVHGPGRHRDGNQGASSALVAPVRTVARVPVNLSTQNIVTLDQEGGGLVAVINGSPIRVFDPALAARAVPCR